MNKQEFLNALQDRLRTLQKRGILSEQEVAERLNFYGEMVDDRMDEGLSEEEAVAAIGSVEDIAAQLEEELSATKPTRDGEPARDGSAAEKPTKTKRPLKAWEIVLLALGSPLWITLLAAAFVVLVAVYAVLWSLIAALWAVFAGLGAVSLGGVAGGIVLICVGNGLSALALMGAGLVCGGLAIFLFFGCLAATVGGARLSALIVRSIIRSIK